MTVTDLIRSLASDIAAYVRDENLAPGSRLAEQRLADHFHVSRSPVRKALRLLESEEFVRVNPGGGYVVGEADVPLSALTAPRDETGADEDFYLRVASDRLDGNLPDKVSEIGLSREYSITRTQVRRILQRIQAEGWIENRPGYGWEFQQTLTSQQSYEDSYRFRAALEPAAMLEPTFELDVERLRTERTRQVALLDGGLGRMGRSELFELNRSFHETIIEASRNSYFVESLRRVDRLRRLIEYRLTLAQDDAVARCNDHVEIADRLLSGDRPAAAELMREHLNTIVRRFSHAGREGEQSSKRV